MMSERLVYYIYWNNLGADAYLYGSIVEQRPLHLVKFENLMMPPGSVIQEWDSIPDFADHPVEPQLPLLEEERRYRVRVFAIYEEGSSALIRIDFLNRLGELTGTEVLREKEEVFTCPAGTYRYRIMLIQGGTSRVLFHHIELIPLVEEVEGNEAESQRARQDQAGTGRIRPGAENDRLQIFREDPSSQALCVLLPEMEGNMYRVPEEHYLEGLVNVTVAPTEAVISAPFHSDDWLQTRQMRSWKDRYFIACTEQTADAAQALELAGYGRAIVVPGRQGLLDLRIR